MAQPLLGFLAFALGTVVVLTVPVLAVWLIVQVIRGLGFLLGGGVRGVSAAVRHVARFVRGEVVDTLHFTGSTITGALIAPLAIGNLAIGRIRAAKHYGAAVEDELTSACISLYRVALGHPVRLVGLGALTDGVERRLPDLVAREPRTTRAGSPHARTVGRKSRERTEPPTFEGYTVHEELRAGGSGARVFRATPSSERAKALELRGIDAPSQVVIKAFDIGYGSTMPQIVRESRSLEAAKRLGLILEHEIDDDAFHYVMPFVPGRDLDALTRELHAKSGASGLDRDSLTTVFALARDLCAQLDRFHGEGLWHKDIKPSNLLVAEGRLHVVDFGLATPLESALTLTTHGTEFFRDPELVRLALAGKRVKDVDGVKFDLYSAGAVLYSMIENSFPAHGSLSSISKRSPEALRWIVRRAMADVDKRYASAEEMARDLDVLALARDPHAVRPADLPSVSGDTSRPRRAGWMAGAAAAGAAVHADEDGDTDVKRFQAFGSTVAVHGLGRLKPSVGKSKGHVPRAERKRIQAEAKAEAKRAKLAANASPAKPDVPPVTAATTRRSRRRGMLRALLVLLIFAGLGGGAETLIQVAQHRERNASTMRNLEARDRSLFTSLPAPYADQVVTTTYSSQDGRSLSPSTESRLTALGRSPRILVVADPSDTGLGDESQLAGEELREMGAVALGVPGRRGRQLDLDELELLGSARYQIELAGDSLEEASARLARLAGQQPDVDAILWLQRDPDTGHMRTVFVRDPQLVNGHTPELEDGDCSDSSQSRASRARVDRGDETPTCATADSGSCSVSVRVSQ